MTLYSRHQLIVLLVLLSAAGFGLAVGHWRRAHPDVVERLEQFDRTPPPAGSLAPPARFPASPERGHPRATPRSARQTSRAARIDLNRADRKSTRLNSSHLVISYAVFCLKKKNKTHHTPASVLLGVPPA